MARRFWTCRKCRYRNERTASRKCVNCGESTKPKTQRPAHEWPLELAKDKFAELNRVVHGVDGDVCAICEAPASAKPLERDHAHHDGGYPRGLLCWLCNKRLGLVERGNDAVPWLVAALRYLRAAEVAHFTDEGEAA